jgi:Bacterial SH3 domain
MRSVRCDVCGTKALMAASQCPKCGHGFEVRDGFGELLPLAHCSSCDSYYPQSAGACRWCGTKPERAPLTPYIWKGVGVLTFVSLAIGAWLVHDDAPSTSPAPPRTFVADTLPTNQPKTQSFGRKATLAQGDSANPLSQDTTLNAALADAARDLAATDAARDTTQLHSTGVVSTEPVSVQSAGTVAQPESLAATVDSSAAPEPSPPPVVAPRIRAPNPRSNKAVDRPATRAPEKMPARTLARTPERTSVRTPARQPARVTAKAPPRVASTPKTAPRSRSSSRWVTSVARNWAVVRADPSRQGRIIAAIGPNTRVQLGETRGAWRRIKTKGLAGWVEHRSLLATLPPPGRSGRLAAQ